VSAAWGIIRIEGESWLSIEAVADCYECETAWLREAWRYGLLGSGLQVEGKLLLHVALLDRVADVIRLGRHQGLAFEVIGILLAAEPAEGFVTAVVVEE
jgi:hypothetical protein